MKKLIIPIFLTCSLFSLSAQDDYFYYKSNLELLRSNYFNYAYAYTLVRINAPKYGRDFFYKGMVDKGIIDETLPSVFESINSQTKYYKQYEQTVNLAVNSLHALNKFPVFFLKLANGKLSLTVNFIDSGSSSKALTDQELINVVINEGFGYFNDTRNACESDEKNKLKRVESIGVTFFIGCADASGADGITLYIHINDIKLYEEGAITKKELITRCTVYRLGDNFKLIQKGIAKTQINKKK